MSFIKGLHDIDNCIKLSKFEGNDLEVIPQENLEKLTATSPRMRICFLDLETTGTNYLQDKIIEIAIKCVELTKETGGDIQVIDAYSSLQDPGMLIPENATKEEELKIYNKEVNSVIMKLQYQIEETTLTTILHDMSNCGPCSFTRIP